MYKSSWQEQPAGIINFCHWWLNLNKTLLNSYNVHRHCQRTDRNGLLFYQCSRTVGVPLNLPVIDRINGVELLNFLYFHLKSNINGWQVTQPIILIIYIAPFILFSSAVPMTKYLFSNKKIHPLKKTFD
jgi:hypothetical protein